MKRRHQFIFVGGVAVIAFTWGFMSAQAAPAAAPAACPVRSLSVDYASIYGAPSNFLTRIDLNGDNRPELLVTDQATCGSKGCEYALYQELTQDCFRRLHWFTGSMEPLPTSRNGFREILIRPKSDPLNPQVERTFFFEPSLQRYVEDTTRASKK